MYICVRARMRSCANNKTRTFDQNFYQKIKSEILRTFFIDKNQ